MGSVQGVPLAAPLTAAGADALSARTHYDPREIAQLHRQFIAEAPHGFIPRTAFAQLAEVMGIREPFLSDLLFSAFDANHDGYISFDEFITAMSTMTRGTPDEKLRFAFRLYDYSPDGRQRGYLERGDVLRIVDSLQTMLGDLVSVGGGECSTPSALVDKLFEEMDTDRDGRISLAEYMAGARNDPAIVQGLDLQ
eukprot:TRINITY_DN25432_c0_g1_i1.p1 TRINITY_DN25432_c0_g1~~TRINITY_DN25432_c0_g1_i1.p1  ORF type:complete len:228 (+),score=78.16 TRINITY_DN25432_c0_g1_i1:101-685(+)